MDDGNILNDDKIVAATKAFRRFLVNGRLSAAEFTLHSFSILLTIDGDDDRLAC